MIEDLERTCEMAKKEGIISHGNSKFMQDSKGRLTPVETIKEEHKLEDELVRELIFGAENLSQNIAQFRTSSVDDVESFIDLLLQSYDVKRGGEKGNITLSTYDQTKRILIAVQDKQEFGAEIEVAKALFDECVTEWSSDSRPEIKALITRAFNTEHSQYNKSELFSLLRLNIEDEKWCKAQKALTDAIKIIGSKQYIRFQKRRSPQDKWENISLNIAG